jgi:hypothetical protein
MWRASFISLLSVLAFTMAGCASIVSLITDGGIQQEVTFNSEPSGAQVIIKGQAIGVTPLKAEVERAWDMTAVIKKEGYEEETVILRARLNPWIWGNIISGGAFGSTTDYLSDGIVEYAPDAYLVTLKPRKASMEELDRWEKEKKVRNFILYSYTNLAHDFAKGGGEYLTSLYALLDMDDSHYGETFDRLKELHPLHRGPLPFAEAVINQFLRG